MGPGPLVAQAISSTCTASQTAQSGSTSVTSGKVTTSEGANLDSDADDTVVQVSANPAPNTAIEGKIETVGDTFRAVFNEQQTASGSITVNAVHMYLLGPTAVGELIVGQSRCAATAGTAAAASSGGTTSVGGGGSRVASTGTEAARLLAVALLLVALGGHGARVSVAVRRREASARTMPWTRRHIFR
jgi:hypothetical protein